MALLFCMDNKKGALRLLCSYLFKIYEFPTLRNWTGNRRSKLRYLHTHR